MTITAAPTVPNPNSPSFATDAYPFTQWMAALGPEIDAESARINAIGFGAYSASSTTSLAVGTGSKSLTIDTGKGYVAGQALLIASTAAPTNYMVGQVTSYNSGTGALVVNVTDVAEVARTNLLTYSEQFDNAAWAKLRSSITANATTAPDGTNTADKLVEDSSTNDHYIVATTTGTTNSASYTFSVMAKAGERTKVNLLVVEGTPFVASAICTFDLVAGTFGAVSLNGGAVGGTAVMQLVSGGFYRCSLTVNLGGVSTTIQSRVRLINAAGAATYTGDGTSGLYIWGAQLESGSYATSYIPTTSSAATNLLPYSDAAWTVSVSAIVAGGGVSPDSIVVLTSGTSWACPTGVTKARLRVVGGGGGGENYGDTSRRSGGGGAGGVVEVFVSLTPATSYTYAIGGSGAVPRGAGGTTSMTVSGVTYSATGGAGGGTWIGGGGGSGSGTGAVVLAGQKGFGNQGVTNYSNVANALSAVGGGYGQGGQGGTVSDAESGGSGAIILELYK